MKLNMKTLQKKFGKKAKEYASDQKKTSSLINDAMRKAETMDQTGPLDTFYKNLQSLFGVMKDWVTGTYKDIPVGSIIFIIMALLYFLSPVDLIPDFLPGGFVDDAFVLGLVINQIKSDLDIYKSWKRHHKNKEDTDIIDVDIL